MPKSDNIIVIVQHSVLGSSGDVCMMYLNPVYIVGQERPSRINLVKEVLIETSLRESCTPCVSKQTIKHEIYQYPIQLN